MNPMRKIELEKVTVNMGVGEAGPDLERAKKLLEKLTGKKVVVTKAHQRNPFGVTKGRPIGVMVTLRGNEARKFLAGALASKDNVVSPDQFDCNGNFSLGIKEYIELPDVKYDPDIGIMGMDVCVTFARPGFRVKKRVYRRGKIGKTHRITREEAGDWLKREFNVNITKAGE